MAILFGGDSADPQPTDYAAKRVWGWYVAGATPHVWSRAEVAELATHGIEGTLPIVVPPQSEKWWDINFGYGVLEGLVREAIAWGIPSGSPLVVDIEEAQAGALGQETFRSWAVACRAHQLIPWTYLPETALPKDLWCNRWLARWPQPAPLHPELPPSCVGWQYASEGSIDLDIFADDHDYLSPTLEVVRLVADAAPSPVVVPTTPAPTSGTVTAPSPTERVKALLTEAIGLLDQAGA